MTKYDLVELQYRLKFTVNGEQKRKVIDRFPEIKGWSIERVKTLLDTAVELSTGKKRKRVVCVGGRYITVERKIKV